MLALTRPNEHLLLKVLLKTEGYLNYDLLAMLSQQFLDAFYLCNQSLVAENPAADKLLIHEQLTLKDLKVAIKVASLLKNQDMQAY